MAAPGRAIQQLRIDNQIVCLERDLLELKRQRNALSSISTIPPELLCEILLQATSHYDRRTFDHPQKLPGRLRADGFIGVLCHVSRTWREVALGCPKLWAEIDVGMTTEALRIEFSAKHAHPLPISVCVKCKAPNTLDLHQARTPKALYAVARLLSETRIFGKLSLEGDINLLSNLLEVIRPERVQALQISVLNHEASQTNFAVAGAILVNQPLFVNGTSGLRALTVLGCTIPLTSNLFSRSPDLTILCATMRRGVNISSTLSTLREMPQLRRLHLGFPYPFQPSNKAISPVALPYLSQVEFQGDALPITATLSHLRLAMDSRMTLACNLFGGENSRQAGIDLFRALAQTAGPLGIIRAKLPSEDRTFAPHQLFFCITIEGRDGMEVTHWTQSAVKDGRFATVRVSMRDQAGSSIHWEKWHPLCLAPRPEDLQESIGWSLDELDVCGVLDDEDNGLLWQLLSKCQEVSQVNVNPCQAFRLLPLLRCNKNLFLFPSLRRIVVEAGGSTSPAQSYDSLLRAFIDALLVRRQKWPGKYGVRGSWGLEKLTFTGFFFPPNEHLVRLARDQRAIEYVGWKR